MLAKSRKYERGFPNFVFDIFTDYQEVGADYIYAILNGYTKPDDPQWNLYYPGHKIAMPQPLTDGVGQIRRRHAGHAARTTPRTSRRS